MGGVSQGSRLGCTVVRQWRAPPGHLVVAARAVSGHSLKVVQELQREPAEAAAVFAPGAALVPRAHVAGVREGQPKCCPSSSDGYGVTVFLLFLDSSRSVRSRRCWIGRCEVLRS